MHSSFTEERRGTEKGTSGPESGPVSHLTLEVLAQPRRPEPHHALVGLGHLQSRQKAPVPRLHLPCVQLRPLAAVEAVEEARFVDPVLPEGQERSFQGRVDNLVGIALDKIEDLRGGGRDWFFVGSDFKASPL